MEATDFRKGKAMKLSDLSTYGTNLPFDPSKYNETQRDPKLARKYIKELLNVPTKKRFKTQRDLLTDEQQDNWIKFNKEVKEHLQTEVAIHQADSVTKLGWEPACDKRPTQLSSDGKLMY